MTGRDVALVSDLIFATKIRSTAEVLGVSVELVRNIAGLVAAAGRGPIRRVIIDLNAEGLDAAAAIATAKGLPGRPHVIAYLSHVQTELARIAGSAGADEVMPRSAFSGRLPEILGGGSPGQDHGLDGSGAGGR